MRLPLTVRRPRKRRLGPGGLALAAALTAGALALSGCATTGITAVRLQSAFAPAFARLYVRQQQLLGHPVARNSSQLQATALCTRGDASVPDQGAGSDWTCGLTFFVDGPGTPVTLAYSLTVRPDGCYTAEDPPVALGRQEMVESTGRSVTNPLYAIDGCFAIS